MNTEKICQKSLIGNGKTNKTTNLFVKVVKMKLKYKNKIIDVTTTKNKTILKYRFQKLYYAIIIKDCNRYSSIANKQRIDVVMTDDNLKILSYKKEMHENTVFADENATTTILLPLNLNTDLEIGQSFSLE